MSPIQGERNSFRFRREEHLKGRDEILAVFRRGKRVGCQGAKLFLLENSLPHNRICFTLSRGFGSAVKRNRARRLSREAYRLSRPRLLQSGLSEGYDLILLVYPEENAALSDRISQLKSLFTKAGLLR